MELQNCFVLTKLSLCNESIISLNAPSSVYSNTEEESPTQQIPGNTEQEHIEGQTDYNERGNDHEGEVNSNSDDNNGQNDGEVNSNSVENDVQTEGENPNCDNNSETSEGSNTTEQEYSMKYRNIFRIPEKLSNEKIQSLLHCSKKQFLHYVESLRPHLKGRNEFLSIYSRVFLFRFKV